MAAPWSTLDLESESYTLLPCVFDHQKDYFVSLFIVMLQATRPYNLFK